MRVDSEPRLLVVVSFLWLWGFLGGHMLLIEIYGRVEGVGGGGGGVVMLELKQDVQCSLLRSQTS